MSGLERRLTKLEAASGHTARLVIFVSLVPSERNSPATATVGGRVWHREPDEVEEAFLGRVGREARLAQPGNDVLVAFLDWPVAPGLKLRRQTIETLELEAPGLAVDHGRHLCRRHRA